MNHISRSELDTLVQTRLDGEPEFRAKLLADPRGTLADIVGYAIPDAIRVTVHEESSSDVHLVLAAEQDELSEVDLELVAGGWGFNNPQPTCGDSCGSCSP